MTKPKILRIVPFYYPAIGFGGPVTHTFNVSKIQAQMGYDVRVFTTNAYRHNLISKTIPRFEIKNGVKIHRCPIRFGIKGTHFWITPSMLSNGLKYNYDIIHAHSYRTFQTDLASLLSKIKRKPLIITAHGNMRDLTRMDILQGKSSSKLIKIYDKIFKSFTINAPDIVIVHSKYEAFWTKDIGVKREKIRIIPHGVDVGKFSNLNLKNKFIKKYQFQGKLIVYVGRILSGYRDLHALIKIMPGILKEVPDAKLLLIGESFDKKYEMELKKLVASLELDKSVHFVTTPTWDDIVGGYLSANVFAFPTNESESFGIPLLEAGASRCPVVAPDVGPIPELIKNNVSGLLTKLNDYNDFKEKIVKILTDESLEKKLGDNAFKIVSENYSWNKITELTNSIYSELL